MAGDPRRVGTGPAGTGTQGTGTQGAGAHGADTHATGGRARRALAGALAVAAVTTGLIVAGPVSPASAVEGKSWGAFARPRGSEDQKAAVLSLEKKLGTRLPLVREYGLWDSKFPNDYTGWLRDSGHTIIWSVRPKTKAGAVVSWKSIASASAGSAVYQDIVGWAKKAKAYQDDFYFVFNHEPEAAASSTYGTPAEFIAAWRKIVTVFRQQKVTNVRFMWVMTEWSFATTSSDRRYATNWYPGDAYVDEIGADAYNDYTCPADRDSTWKPLAEDIAPFMTFGAQHPDKGLWLPEFGSFHDPAQPSRKAQWINEVRAMLKKPGYDQLRGLVYFHALREGTPCSWWLDDSTATLNAWRGLARDSFYGVDPAQVIDTALAGGDIGAVSEVGAGSSGTGSGSSGSGAADGGSGGEDAASGDATSSPGTTTGKAVVAGSEVTLVVGSAAAPTEADLSIADSLRAGGGSVSLLSAADVPTATIADDATIWVTSSVPDSRTLGLSLKARANPIVVAKPWLFDDLALAGTAPWADFGLVNTRRVTIMRPGDPLAAGLSGTVVTTSGRLQLAWGTVPWTAQVVAQAGGDVVLARIPRGSMLSDGGTAVGCRILAPFHASAATSLTPSGEALLRATVAGAQACR